MPDPKQPQLIQLTDLLPKANVKGSGAKSVVFGVNRDRPHTPQAPQNKEQSK
jgi:hypothetical protein